MPGIPARTRFTGDDTVERARASARAQPVPAAAATPAVRPACNEGRSNEGARPI
jgi:hypothetical protein